MKTENWLNCHVHAFDYFGGVARLLIPDNTYAEACDDMKTENWLNCHVHAFDFFGGVARLLIPDNCKTATLSNTRYDLILNRSYQELAEHYGTAIVPARVRRPKDYRRKNVIGNSMKDSQNTPIIRYL